MLNRLLNLTRTVLLRYTPLTCLNQSFVLFMLDFILSQVSRASDTDVDGLMEAFLQDEEKKAITGANTEDEFGDDFGDDDFGDEVMQVLTKYKIIQAHKTTRTRKN